MARRAMAISHMFSSPNYDHMNKHFNAYHPAKHPLDVTNTRGSVCVD
jgi:hypothetical protein